MTPILSPLTQAAEATLAQGVRHFRCLISPACDPVPEHDLKEHLLGHTLGAPDAHEGACDPLRHFSPVCT